MNEWTDQELLRDYAERRSEAAFSELVRRHIDLVHSAALRMVCDSHLAQDVTQNTFVALAQNAAQLTNRPVLSGWLHRTAQNLASKTVRTDVRRRAREQEAAAMNELLAESGTDVPPDWAGIAPHLDAALGELSEPDRDALLLRYFERKSAHEMAQRLGISDEAAQKRVSRAVQRLRESFAKRSVSVGASGLIVVISANAVQAAPVGLAATISTATALAGKTLATAATATKTIAMTTLQKILITSAIIVSVATPLAIQRQAHARLRDQIELLRKQGDQLAKLHDENTRLSSFQSGREISAPLPNEQFREVLRLRDEIGRLQAEVRDLKGPKTNAPLSREEVLASMRQLYVDRVNRLKGLLQANYAQPVPELQYLTDGDWLESVEYDHHRIDPDNRHLISAMRSNAQIHFAMGLLADALRQYGKNNGGQFPSDISELKPYFKSPVDDSVLQNWAILPTRSLPPEMRVEEDNVITQKAPIDPEHDQRVVVGLKTTQLGNGTNQWGVVP